jgi:hypothetical protein
MVFKHPPFYGLIILYNIYFHGRIFLRVCKKTS